MSQEPAEPNIGRVLGFARRRGLWVALCVVLAAVVAYGLSKRETKKYTATASLVFNTSQLSQQIAGLSVTSTNLLIQQANNLELLHLGDMAERTAEKLGRGLTSEKVRASLSIVGQTESNIAGVSATTTSPMLSAEVANAYTEQFVVEQQKTNRQYFKSALALVHRQLAALTRQQRNGTAGVTLQDRAQSLGLLSELQPNTVQVAQKASAPARPSSPKTSRNTLIGAILGLFVGLGVALLLERLDPRIQDVDEFEEIYRAPLLGTVHRSAALSRPRRQGDDGPAPALPPVEAEAFHMIRARLRSFNTDRDLRTILVSSAAPGEGKTTVACNLASAAARMGSRVLLLEVNLRRPTLAQRVGISASTGLPDVLGGMRAMGGVTHAIESQVSLGAGGMRTFDVLPSGPSIPANPVAMIESRPMDDLLAQARLTYDLVVVDAQELAAVSDAFLLLSRVDGVVIVGRMGHSRRDAAEALMGLLHASAAPLVGIIANGVRRDRKARVHLRARQGDFRVAGKSSEAASTGDDFIPSVKA